MMAHLVNLDWLAFSVRLANRAIMDEGAPIVLTPPSGCTLFEATATNIYRRRVIVYRNGAKLLTLLADPYSKVIARDTMLVEVANKWLYGDLSWVMPMLYEIHPCSMVGFSRVDICADFPRVGAADEVVSALRLEDVYVAEKREGSLFFNVEDEARNIRAPKCFSWGSKTSSIKWKLYNKSLEIFDWAKGSDGQPLKVCNKPYILDAWRSAGFGEDNIWRLEVSVSDANKFHFEGHTIEWADILQRDRFEALFNSLYMTRFVTRRNEGHTERRRDTRVYLLGEQPVTDRVRIRPPRYESTVVEYANGLNTAMRQLELPEVASNPAAIDVWCEAISRIVEVGNLQAYFSNTYGMPVETFIRQRSFG